MVPFVSAGIGHIPLKGKDETGAVSVRAWALVDACDFMDVARFNWHLTTNGYAARWYGGRPPKRKKDRMHRRVLGLSHEDPRRGDHINRNRLDNRRSNLRPSTEAENKQNVPSNRNVSSAYRGVSWDAPRGKWKAQGKAPGEPNRFLGRFDTEREAAEAARKWRGENMPGAVD